MSRRSGWAIAGPLFLLIGAILGVSVLAASRAEPVERFELVDVAQEVGLDATHSAFRWGVTMDPVAMMGGGACWIDVDADGWLDLFLTDSWANGEWGRWNDAGGVPTTRVFRNNAGSFEEYTEQWSAGFEARAGGCVAADFDNDGYTDLYVTTERANLLLWNEAGTGFVEGATAAGVAAYGWTTGVAAGDLNGDGLLDLVVAGYADLNKARPEATTGFPNPFEAIADLVFINAGEGSDGRPSFTSVGTEVGIEPDGPEYGLGVVLVDLDGDGDLDVHIANDTQPNRVYLNEQASDGSSVRLVDVSELSGADDPNSGMGIGTAELNGDGFPDLLVTNLQGQGHASLASSPAALAPSFEATLDDVYALGIDKTGWGASFGDLDLDGDLDLLIASGAIPITDVIESGEAITYFSNETTGLSPSLVDRSERAGLDDVAARNGRSVAMADYDNDGDLDALVTSIGQRVVLLENRSDTRNQWLTIDFTVPSPGTRVNVELEDGTVLVRWATAGGSWLSSEDPRLNFGLGPDPGVVDVTILPLSGGTLRFDDVALNRILVVVQ